MEFLSLKSESFGLDISDLSIKVVKLKKKGKFLGLASFGEIEIKPGLVEEGEIKDEDALAKTIKEGLGKLKGEKLKTKNVIASLPEKKSFLQVIQMPKMQEEELKASVSFEAENYIPLPIEEVYLDFQIVNPLHDNLDHTDILLAASPRKIVDPYVSCLKKAGLFPYVLEIESQSVARALVKNSITSAPVFLVDFGKNATTFVVYSGRALRFTSTLAISSQQLTEAISTNLKVSLADAEKLKIKYGLQALRKNIQKKEPASKEEDNKESKKVGEIVLPILEDFAKEIKKCISYYQTHASHEHLTPSGKDTKNVEKVILCGGGANLSGLPDFISSLIRVPVQIGNPWTNILPEPLKELPQMSFRDSLGYTAALGLALRGMGKS